MWCTGCQRGQQPVNGRCPDCNSKLTVEVEENGTLAVGKIELGGGYTEDSSYEERDSNNDYTQTSEPPHSEPKDESKAEEEAVEKPKKRRGRKKKGSG